jgi:putative MFS transporter
MLPSAAGAVSILARVDRVPLSRWHFRVLALVGTANFFDGFEALTISVVMPILAVVWKLSPTNIGFLISAGYVGQALGSVGFGWLAERIGRLRAMRWAVALIAILSLFCATAWTMQSLVIFRFVQGLGLGGEVPVAATYMNEVLPSRIRGRLIFILMLLFTFGVVCVSFAAIWILPHFGWRAMFIIGGTGILIVPMLGRLPESPLWLLAQGRSEDAKRAMRSIERAGAAQEAEPQSELDGEIAPRRIQHAGIRILFSPLYVARTLGICAMTLCMSIVVYSLATWLPTIYRTVYHLPLQQALEYGVAAPLASITGALMGLAMVDVVGRRRTLICGFLGALPPLVYLWLQGAAIAPLQLAVLGFIVLSFMSMLISCSFLYTPEIYATEARAVGVGLASAWLRIGSIVGPPMVGFLLSFAKLRDVFLLFAVTALLGAVLAQYTAIETRRRPAS